MAKYIGLIMAISALIPFLFLSASGRQAISVTKLNRYSGLLLVFVLGLMAKFVLHRAGILLYKDAFQNW